MDSESGAGIGATEAVCMEVNVDKEPAEGEVFIFTTGGGFVVKGTAMDVSRRLSAEEWAHFELAESGDPVIVRSAHVIALRSGSKSKRGSIGFVHRED
jgi:hypothetical protein